jgi:hypothetical protein
MDRPTLRTASPPDTRTIAGHSLKVLFDDAHDFDDIKGTAQ